MEHYKITKEIKTMKKIFILLLLTTILFSQKQLSATPIAVPNIVAFVKVVEVDKVSKADIKKTEKATKKFNRQLKRAKKWMKRNKKKGLLAVLGGGILGFFARRRIKRQLKKAKKGAAANGDGCGIFILPALLLAGLIWLLAALGFSWGMIVLMVLGAFVLVGGFIWLFAKAAG